MTETSVPDTRTALARCDDARANYIWLQNIAAELSADLDAGADAVLDAKIAARKAHAHYVHAQRLLRWAKGGA